jgi:hypothetical protein
MKPRRLLVHAALVLSVVQAQAQTATSVRDEYANAVSAAQSPTAFGPDLFGESVNLKDGVTVFSTTDVAGRTQSGLPLAVTRTLGVNAADTDKYVNPEVDGELFGNWKLDVPVIHGTFDERTGWVVASNTPASRCSSGYTPPGVPSAFSNWQITYLPEQYWHGNEISIPGHGKYPLLALPADRPRPDDGQTYVGTTRGDWRVSCVPTLKNGSGEGFKVSLPDGTKYTFDWMSSRKVAALKDKHCKVAYYNEYNVANWSWSYWTFGPNDPSDPNDPNGHWRLNGANIHCTRPRWRTGSATPSPMTTTRPIPAVCARSPPATATPSPWPTEPTARSAASCTTAGRGATSTAAPTARR